MVQDPIVDMAPPHDLEAEQAVLGSVFLDNQALAEAMQYVKPSDFYHQAHRIMFSAMVNLSSRNKAIDSITVPDYLRATQQLNNSGGIKYIASIATAVPTAANVKYYANIVREKSVSRKMILAGQKISQAGYDQKESLDDRLENAEQTVMHVSQDRENSGLSPLDLVMGNTLKDVGELSENTSAVTGIPMGYPAIDKITTGLHGGEFVIVAARPAMGKTTFALNVARNVANKTQGEVALFSLEMGANSLATRLLCAQGNLSANHLRTGNLTADEWQNMIVSSAHMDEHTHVNIDDTPGLNIASIMARSRRIAKEKGNLRLIVVDYLQLIEGHNTENRQQEVSEVSRQLKKLAKELDVPVIALSQLSRKVEQREDKRPVLSDIRESGSIEQDADIVSFLYRKDYYQRNKDGDKQHTQQDNGASDTEFIIEKNRSGPRGTVHLMFLKDRSKFSSIIEPHAMKH